MSDLKRWIQEELTVDIENELSKYKEKVKEYIQLTPSGEVILKQTDLTAKQKILVYLIGKIYAKAAEYSDENNATNKELAEALRLPEGTVKYTLFELRNEGLVLPIADGVHSIRISSIGLVFDRYFGGEKKVE